MKTLEPCAARVNGQGQLTLLFPLLINRGEVGAWNPVKGHHEVSPCCPTLRHPCGSAEMRATATLMGSYIKQFKTPLYFVKDAS